MEIPREIRSDTCMVEAGKHCEYGVGVVPPVKKKINTLHQKQLSADSSSPRMKYNFNSSPNLRPKSTSTLTPQSSPNTPISGRRKPPPPPSTGLYDSSSSSSGSSISSDDDNNDSVEVKAVTLLKRTGTNVTSAPNLPTRLFTPPVPRSPLSHEVSPFGSHSSIKQLRSDNHSTPVLDKRASSFDDVIRDRIRKPTAGYDCASLDRNPTRKVRRPPPPPPIQGVSRARSPTWSCPRSNPISNNGYSHNVSRQQEPSEHEHTSRYDSTNSKKLPSYSQLEKKTLSPPGNATTYATRTLPPGVLFTPPPSRSHSLKKFATSSQRKRLSEEKKAKLVAPSAVHSAVPPSKPLPLLPSLSKPLPPLPTSDNDTVIPASIESDYAYIPDFPPPTTETMATKLNEVAGKQPSSLDTDDYMYMSSIDIDTIRKPSQIGVTDDEYVSMVPEDISNTTTVTSSQAECINSALPEVFREEELDCSDEYMPMFSQLDIGQQDDGSTDDAEYVKMASANKTHSTTSTAMIKPTPMKQSSETSLLPDTKPDPLFNYTSMYIDLDMVRASIASPQQTDNEAKHPKSRFSISSSSSDKDELTTKKSTEGLASSYTSHTSPRSIPNTHAPSHHAPLRSKVVPLPNIVESPAADSTGIYVSITDSM